MIDIAGAVTGLLVAGAGVWRMVGPIVMDARNQAAFREVTRAGLLASSEAGAAVVEAFAAARAPTSDGGSAITQSEVKTIAQAGVTAGMAAIKRLSGVTLKNVLAVYGGEDLVRASIITMVNKAVAKRISEAVGTAATSTAAK